MWAVAQAAESLTQPGAAAAQEPTLQAFLARHTQAELVALLSDRAQPFPEVRDALAVRQMLARDDAGQLEAEVLGRIIDATAEPGWRNRWDGDGHAPDYGPVYKGVKRLRDRGHADAVVRLGEHLLKAGISQVEQSHDDGETAVAVASCLSVVFQALPLSSLEPDEQITWAIDALLREQRLHQAGFAVAVINPAQAHAFARWLPRRAKTEALAAHLLAQLAAERQPPRWTPPEQIYPELRQRLVVAMAY